MAKKAFLGLKLPDSLSHPKPLEPDVQSLHDLAETAYQNIKKRGLTPNEAEKEHNAVYEALSDCLENHPESASHRAVLRHYAEHAGKHGTHVIADTFHHMAIIKDLPLPPEHLTDDHFVVYRELNNTFIDGKFKDGEEGEDIDEFYAVTDYALTHIEDGHLIMSLLKERGLGTLKSILDVLPELKANSGVLTEGSL